MINFTPNTLFTFGVLLVIGSALVALWVALWPTKPRTGNVIGNVTTDGGVVSQSQAGGTNTLYGAAVERAMGLAITSGRYNSFFSEKHHARSLPPNEAGWLPAGPNWHYTVHHGSYVAGGIKDGSLSITAGSDGLEIEAVYHD